MTVPTRDRAVDSPTKTPERTTGSIERKRPANRHARTWEHWVALAIVVCATALCALWAIRVPMFQEPDEIAHADAAFAYFDSGKPFSVRHAIVRGFVTPEERYLAKVTNYRRLRYDNHASVPSGYGSRSYFKNIDVDAPVPADSPPLSGAPLPYALALYPSPYYVMVGIAMRAGWAAFGHSLSAAFFAGRLINVALLGATLACAYLVLLCVGLHAPQRLMLLFAMSFFPMSTWMGAYIQPDNQSALLMTASLLAAVALRRHPKSLALLLTLGIAESALGVTKLQYALVAIVGLGLALRNTFDAQSRFARARALVIGCAVPLVMTFVGHYLSPFGALGIPPRGMAYAHMSLQETLWTAARDGMHSMTDTYLGGETFQSFWYHFGIRSAGAFSGGSATIVSALLVFLTILTFVAHVARQIRLARRLRGVAERYGFARAFAFVGNDPALNVYVLVTALLVSLYAFTGGYLTLQGRYWYPVLIPLVILSVRIFAASCPRRHAKAGATVACAFWFCYAAISAPAAVTAMEGGFYHNRYVEPTFELGEVESVTVDGRTTANLESDLRVPLGEVVTVRGSALDTSLGLPATDIRYRIDGGAARHARTGIPDRTLSIVFNDERLAYGGFVFDLDTRRLDLGAHDISIAAYERRAPMGLPIQRVRISVVPRATTN